MMMVMMTKRAGTSYIKKKEDVRFSIGHRSHSPWSANFYDDDDDDDLEMKDMRCICQVTGHPAQSMMTRYRDVISRNLDQYNIPDNWKSCLTGNLALAAQTPQADAGRLLSFCCVIPSSGVKSLRLQLDLTKTQKNHICQLKFEPL